MSDFDFRNVSAEGADLHLPHGVVVEFSRSSHGDWEVWGVRIDGHLYREPRDLQGELLKRGPMHDELLRREPVPSSSGGF